MSRTFSLQLPLDETEGGTGLTAISLGDTIYGSGTNTISRLTGNTTVTRKYLSQIGNGSISAAPTWESITTGDVSKVGTPVDNQIGVWTGNGTIEGTTGLTYDGSNLLLTGDIGSTGTRITKGWFTDLAVTNAISGSITGNAGTVTNGIYTTSDVTALAATSAGNKDKYLHSNASTGVLEWSTVASGGASTALDNLASVAINTSLISDTDNTDDLGSADKAWKDIYSRTLKLDGSTSGTVTIDVAAEAGTWSLTLPTSDGDNGQYLQTDGSGNTTWATPGGGTAAAVTVANEATDETCFPLFVTAATGDLGPKSNANLKFNSSTGVLGAAGLALGAGSITMTGSIATTGDRVTKGWFTDVEITNLPTINGGTLATALSLGTMASETATNYVAKSLFDANTMLYATADNTPLALTIGASTIVGRKATGDIVALTGAEALTISGGESTSNKKTTLSDDSDTYYPSQKAVKTAVDAKAPSASPTLTGTVTLSDNCRIDLTLPTADTYCTGNTTDSFASGYSASAADLVFMGSSSKWLEVDADAVATCKGLLGIALEAKNDTEAMKVALPGSFVRFDAWNWTVGATLYAGETLGAIQETIPTGADAIIKVVGFAVNADTIYFNPSPDQQSTVA